MPVSNKVTAATVAAALGSILIWALQTYAHTALPEPVQAAVVVLLTLIVGWAIPEHNPAPSAVETIRRQARG